MKYIKIALILVGITILLATSPQVVQAQLCTQQSGVCVPECTIGCGIASPGGAGFADCQPPNTCCSTDPACKFSNQDTNDNSSFTQIERSALPGFRFSGASIGSILSSTFPWIFGIAGILLLLYLLYGGFHLMISGGEPKVVAEAKGKITNALIGFVIIFVAFWIVQIIGRVFGLTPIIDIFG